MQEITSIEMKSVISCFLFLNRSIECVQSIKYSKKGEPEAEEERHEETQGD